eukprot:jgi/Tetstr1/436117/TSEL_024964.t1
MYDGAPTPAEEETEQSRKLSRSGGSHPRAAKGLGVATCWAYGEGVKKGTDILQHVAALDPQHLSDPLRAIPYLASEFSTQVSILSRGRSLLPMR